MVRQTSTALRLAVAAVVLAGLGYAAWFGLRNYRGVTPAIIHRTPAADEADGLGLTLPPGFALTVWARQLPSARVLVFDPDGNAWVSQRQEGTVTKLLVRDGQVIGRREVLSGLKNPHGLAFDPTDDHRLFVAAGNELLSLDIRQPEKRVHVADLPAGGQHVTRTIGFGPDNKLYVSIGSTCNVCVEDNEQRAAILRMNRDGSARTIIARGLRNSVFFVWHGGRLWATENGRDLIGDDLPPDEINVISDGQDYGWPACYGQNVLDARGVGGSTCQGKTPSTIDIPAHSAPLGLAFVDAPNWPDVYQGNLIVAYHGSWNRSVPTGYKVVRMIFDAAGKYQRAEDFITGWLRGSSSSGRPVDPILHDGQLYLTDDAAGVIYRVDYRGSTSARVGMGCAISGCNGEVCTADGQAVVTVCAYRPEYVCYRSARCERQADGACGWTVTPALRTCLDREQSSSSSPL